MPTPPAGTFPINTRWFQEKFEAHNLSQRRVAKHLAVDPSSISQLIHGKRELTIDEAAKLAHLLGVPVEEVLMAAGIKPKLLSASEKMIPIKGWVDSELKIHWGLPRGPKTAPVPAFGGKDVSVLRYQTMGTSLEAMDGALVYFIPVEGIASDATGRMCVVELAGQGRASSGDYLLAVVKRGYGGAGLVNLCDFNGKLIAEGVALRSASPVVWIKL